MRVVMSTGGDFKALIIPIVSFIIGMIIYYLFIKAYEKQGLEKEKQNELENSQLESTFLCILSYYKIYK